MYSESQIHVTNNDSEMKLSDTKDSKESRKVQAGFLENPNQNKVKKNVSTRSEIHATSEISIEKSNCSTDESSSKRQKLNESGNNTSARKVSDDTLTFQRNELEQQNYCKEQNTSRDTENISWNSLFNDITRETPILDVFEGNVASAYTENDSVQKESSNSLKISRAESEMFNDESDQYKDKRGIKKPSTNYLEIKKSSPNWFGIVPEVTNRQIGNSPLFQRRFHGSLLAMERLEFMYSLNDKKFVTALNFNQKGNLLVSACRNSVSIWDWAIRKKRHCFTINCFFILQAIWLPLDVENFIVICDVDGTIRLLDLEHNASKLIMDFHKTRTLAVHPETPYVVFSAGIDSKVFSIDIRENTPNELLVVREDQNISLYSIHCNPSNSNEFCVSGDSFCVRVYDRRNVSKPLYQLWSRYDMNESPFIRTAMYNHNGTEILALCNFDSILLFDKSMWINKSCEESWKHMYEKPPFQSVHVKKFRIKLEVINFFGSNSEYIMSGSNCGDIFIYDKDTGAGVQQLPLYDSNHTFFSKRVSCLVGHPHIPILATTYGSNVRMWSPSSRESPAQSTFKNEEFEEFREWKPRRQQRLLSLRPKLSFRS
ncbi:PREDICTED: DDB1- and CUL4-associated factor 8-like [Atta colombica]|uniref:DDB1- and CUL4-associated factor 8-like n=1 Tax=Atta colombica TaxID=520822 RepID=UPI00084BEDFA|nr:PREDICTED: DDB1- and CUL4-associated factor 8-like [Atta colombica]XP_018048342.1 PREDICTED: DDB1- and CUL4-associated factor 8-like [Atta colombica]XP_018048343.1 PREDICTED: DDB1- and CUL4-associated factor 8-like [Atta colombica]XP_018048344.1 PREDICTED: DDB1- and CUL4-associated factor 8-like [Atta colombica]